MEEINEKKLKRLANISINKEKGIFIEIDDLDDRVSEMEDTLKTTLKGEDGDDGEDYVLTLEDKKEIASMIKVPVVEKVIEKTETIIEKPIEITNNQTVEKTIEIAKYQTTDELATELNKGKEIINLEVIKGLRKQLDELEAKLFISANQTRPMPSGGSMGVFMLEEGNKVNGNPIQYINFVGGGATVTYVGQDTAVVSIIPPTTTLYTETPVGDIDGVNLVYTTLHDITTVYSFAINGQFIHPAEYTISGNQITFINPIPADLAGTNYTLIYA